MRAFGRAVLAALCLCVLAAGCGGGRAPETRYYLPRLPASNPGAAGSAGLDVGVAAFHVDPPYDGDRIVYRVGSDSPEVGFYTYHRWAAPLGRTLPVLVAERLAGVAGIGSIEPVVPGRRYGARIEGRVRALEEVDTNAGPHVRIVLRLALLDPEGSESWSRELSAEAPAPAREVRSVVEAMGAALSTALDEARGDLARTLATKAP